MSARPIGKRAHFRLFTPAQKRNAGSFPGLGLHRFLLVLLAWICRPGKQVNFDSFSEHMLRDIGVDPKTREDSTTGFWRRR